MDLADTPSSAPVSVQLEVPPLLPGYVGAELPPQLVVSMTLHPRQEPHPPPAPRALPARRCGETPDVLQRCTQ